MVHNAATGGKASHSMLSALAKAVVGAPPVYEDDEDEITFKVGGEHVVPRTPGLKRRGGRAAKEATGASTSTASSPTEPSTDESGDSSTSRSVKELRAVFSPLQQQSTNRQAPLAKSSRVRFGASSDSPSKATPTSKPESPYARVKAKVDSHRSPLPVVSARRRSTSATVDEDTSALREQVAHLEKQLEEAWKAAGPAAMEAVRAELRHTQGMLERVKAQRDSYAQACQDAAGRIDELERELTTSEGASQSSAERERCERSRLEGELEHVRSTAAKAVDEAVELGGKLAAAREELKEVSESLATAKEEGARAEEVLRATAAERDTLAEDLQQLRNKFQVARQAKDEELARLTKKLEEVTSQRDALSSEAKVQRELSKSKVMAAEQAQAESARETVALREDLEALKSKVSPLLDAVRSAKQQASDAEARAKLAEDALAAAPGRDEARKLQAEVDRLKLELFEASKTQEELMGMIEELQGQVEHE
jgi:chromosome segregation ATPase